MLILISLILPVGIILVYLGRIAHRRNFLKTYVSIVSIFILVLVGLIFRPVCVPISDEELKSFNVPIEQREDRDFYLKVFQKKNGQWYQCKTWISRFFYF